MRSNRVVETLFSYASVAAVKKSRGNFYLRGFFWRPLCCNATIVPTIVIAMAATIPLHRRFWGDSANPSWGGVFFPAESIWLYTASQGYPDGDGRLYHRRYNETRRMHGLERWSR